MFFSRGKSFCSSDGTFLMDLTTQILRLACVYKMIVILQILRAFIIIDSSVALEIILMEILMMKLLRVLILLIWYILTKHLHLDSLTLRLLFVIQFSEWSSETVILYNWKIRYTTLDICTGVQAAKSVWISVNSKNYKVAIRREMTNLSLLLT